MSAIAWFRQSHVTNAPSISQNTYRNDHTRPPNTPTGLRDWKNYVASMHLARDASYLGTARNNWLKLAESVNVPRITPVLLIAKSWVETTPFAG